MRSLYLLHSALQTRERAPLGVHGQGEVLYHHVDPKHLGRYVDEFTFRLNDGNVKRHTMQRLDSLARSTRGRRITYKELTG